MINIFQNLGTIPFSQMGRHRSAMMGCNFQKYIFTSVGINTGFPNISGKRCKREVCTAADSGCKEWAGLQKQFTQMSGREGKWFNWFWLERRDWTTLSELPCRPLCAAQAALLLSRLVQILPSWQRSKVVYFFPLQDTALYKCQQMNPDKVINQFNRMKAPCTKRWREIIA